MSCVGSRSGARLLTRSTGFSFLLAPSAFSLGLRNLSPFLSAGRESTTPSLRAWGVAGTLEPCVRPPSALGGAGRHGAPSRTRALRPTRPWMAGGGSPSGRGSEDFFSHPLLERVHVPPCTRARSGCPGQSARCGAAGLTVLLVGSSHIVFKVVSQVLSRSVRLHRSSGVPQSSLSLLGSLVTGNRRGSCPKEVDTPTSRSCGFRGAGT